MCLNRRQISSIEFPENWRHVYMSLYANISEHMQLMCGKINKDCIIIKREYVKISVMWYSLKYIRKDGKKWIKQINNIKNQLNNILETVEASPCGEGMYLKTADLLKDWFEVIKAVKYNRDMCFELIEEEDDEEDLKMYLVLLRNHWTNPNHWTISLDTLYDKIQDFNKESYITPVPSPVETQVNNDINDINSIFEKYIAQNDNILNNPKKQHFLKKLMKVQHYIF
jgi:hypothetical protein